MRPSVVIGRGKVTVATSERTRGTQRARSGGTNPPRARATQPSVRLLALLATAAMVFLLIGGAAEAGQPPPPTISYVVEPGDTLWEIASGLTTPGDDIREMVGIIKELSGIDSATIFPGQTLQLPQG
jgi:LysM repeat protein